VPHACLISASAKIISGYEEVVGNMWGRAWPGSVSLELCVFVRAVAIEAGTGVRRESDGSPDCIANEENERQRTACCLVGCCGRR